MNEYPCTAMSLSHYIVDKCTRDGHPVSNLQLQKIMYFLQSIFCMSQDKLLFADVFEAWPYGPVLRSVYNEYASFGGRKIEMKYQDTCALQPEIKSFVDSGIEVLRVKSPWDLVRTSHADDSPWAKVFKNGAGYKEPIPNELIIEDSRRKAGVSA